MRKEEVKNYTITTDGPSGLEFELHLMPQFFNSAVCLEQSSTVFTRSPNGVIALADIIGDETYRKFFVEITNLDCTK